MKFIEKDTLKTPVTFADVVINQFFVSQTGNLYQKIDYSSANMIATSDGAPLAYKYDTFTADTEIMRCLPEFMKIDF